MMSPTTTVRCDDVKDLLPAYSLGALDGDEALLVGEHLSSCSACRAELSRYQAVVDQLSEVTPVAPPSELRERVLASAAHATTKRGVPIPFPPTAPDRAMVSVPSTRRRRVFSFGLAAAAVVLIAAVALLATMLSAARESRDDAEAAERQLASYLSAGGEVTAMASLSAANYGYSFGQGSLVTVPGKPPLVVVGGCPESSEDREYRVWLERDGDRTRVGILNVGEEGSGWLTFDPPEPLSSYDSIGVTMVTGDARNDLFVGATGLDTS